MNISRKGENGDKYSYDGMKKMVPLKSARELGINQLYVTKYDGRAGMPRLPSGNLRTSQPRCERREVERNTAKYRFSFLSLARAATALYVYGATFPVLGKYPCLHLNTQLKRKLKGWENCDICGLLTY